MSQITDDIKNEIGEVAVGAVVELIEDTKIDPDRAVDLLSATLDALVPLNLLIPGPLGDLAENVDDTIFDELAKVLHKAFTLDPDKLEMRAEQAEEKGHEKLASRRRKRAVRVRKRQQLKIKSENKSSAE